VTELSPLLCKLRSPSKFIEFEAAAATDMRRKFSKPTLLGIMKELKVK
jgi:hypothetical protein